MIFAMRIRIDKVTQRPPRAKMWHVPHFLEITLKCGTCHIFHNLRKYSGVRRTFQSCLSDDWSLDCNQSRGILVDKKAEQADDQKKIGSDDDGNSNDEDDLDEENDERGLESLF
jgi:hypothetical protein